jgi:hypothetical protein
MLQQESIIAQSNMKIANINDNFQDKTIFEKKPNFRNNSFILSRHKYPDLRFSCPNCGTLDVLIQQKHFDSLKGSCLDCKIDWNEDGNL